MTPLDYWRGWAVALALGSVVLYGVIRAAVRAALKDHDHDSGIVRR